MAAVSVVEVTAGAAEVVLAWLGCQPVRLDDV